MQYRTEQVIIKRADYYGSDTDKPLTRKDGSYVHYVEAAPLREQGGPVVRMTVAAGVASPNEGDVVTIVGEVQVAQEAKIGAGGRPYIATAQKLRLVGFDHATE